MFAREGYVLMLGATVIGVILSVVALYVQGVWPPIFWILAVFVVAFTFYFFRDPDRTPPADTTNLILAPADGKVVLVEEVDESIYLASRAKKVSIFLSPLDVHVNRIPVNGVIEFDRYISGSYLVAWHPKASDLNERSEFGLKHATGSKVLFKQIAGAVGRRIVYHIKTGDEVVAGDRFGIVKFGSRMDVLVPLSAEIFVKVGDRVCGGETVIGQLNDEESDES